MAKRKTPKGYSPASSGDFSEFTTQISKEWGCVVPGAEIEKRDGELLNISTGSVKLDWAITKPYVEGTISEIFGPNGTGKTTLALEAAATATRMGKPVFFFDLERKLVASQVNMIPRLRKELFCRVRPENGEDAVEKIIECILNVPGCLIIFDSLTAMLPEVEDAGSASDQQRAAVARLAAKMVRKILGPVEKNRCIVLFISHTTANMEAYSGEIKTKGGDAVKNASAQRIMLKNKAAGRIKDADGNQIGQNVICKVIKNNQGIPYREVEVPIIYGRGIARSMDLTQICVELGLIDKASKGGWHTFEYKGETKKLQPNAMYELIRTDKDFRESLIKSVHEIL